MLLLRLRNQDLTGREGSQGDVDMKILARQFEDILSEKKDAKLSASEPVEAEDGKGEECLPAFLQG